ncbi:uncharacterized protein DUF2029 [Chitinophaga skermanii]|uniref:Uncharacterized protein DUF2029 n=2 Tax=Chitinophaga skermanii TaxID=331697 RepID=A0A327QM27_9BACT|nr:uncharacterized protein DUF2029 [Chitinophaga skermanii]
MAVYALGTIILYIQSITTGRYNNFIIFKASLGHVLHGQPLYRLYPAEYFDYYLYHPSFPLLFAPFAVFPKEIGLFIWLMSSTAVFLYALYKLPMKRSTQTALGWMLVLELLNAIQSAQTNPAMTAFMLLAVMNMDRRKPALAALFTCLCFFIKGYGAIIGLLFLFFEDKWKYLLYCAFFGIVGTLLPLLFLSPAQLIQEYTDWFHLITSSTIKEDGSVMGMIHAIFGLQQPFAGQVDKYLLLVAGLGMIWALVKTWQRPTAPYTWLMLGYLMLWIVLFNQSTESPTYIIAVTGAAMGLLMLPKGRTIHILLCLLVVICCLCPTDLVPKFINRIAITYRLKALPTFLVLLYFQYYIGVKPRNVVL